MESQTSLKLGCDSFFLAEETSLVLTTVVTPMPKSMPFPGCCSSSQNSFFPDRQIYLFPFNEISPFCFVSSATTLLTTYPLV